jgi:hypothetical protein
MSGADFNSWFRRSAGRDVPAAARELERERPVADLGVGRGGAAGVQPRPTSNADLNNRIRAGITLARHAAIAGGIRLDDTDVDRLYGR